MRPHLNRKKAEYGDMLCDPSYSRKLRIPENRIVVQVVLGKQDTICK
jgi:hypothetical protein